MDDFDIVSFAVFSANTAWDQRRASDDARADYFDNLRSTFGDFGITDQYVIAEAERAYNQRADELFGARN